MRLRYIGTIGTNTGYSQAVSDNCMALLQAGVDLDIQHLPDGEQEGLQQRYAKLLDYYHKKPQDWPTHVLVHTTPRAAPKYIIGAPPGAKRICYTTWETNKLPREDAEALSAAFDLILVPSQFCAKAFLEGGVKNLRIIPHTFDPNFWYGISPADKEDRDEYVFYSTLVWNARKNPIGLLTAYWTAFADDPNRDVLLRLVCGVTPNVTRELMILKKALNLPHYAPVEFVQSGDGWVDEEAYRAVHHNGDCYVSLTRSEGWGLGMFEAAIVGNPVIATNWSGHRDFLPMERFHPVKMMLTPCVQVRHGIDGTQHWAEPDLLDAQKWMRTVATRQTKRVPPDAPSQKLLVEKYSYGTVGNQFKQLLESM